MPEGPEVRLLCTQLSTLLTGMRLERIEIYGGPIATSTAPRYTSLRASLEAWRGATITRIHPHGKTMFWETTIDQVLVSHLGMEGTFSEEKTKHALLALVFSGKTPRTVYFNDSRRFGTVGVRGRAEAKKDEKRLGPDILEFDDWPEVIEKILHTRSKTEVSTKLLDQSFVAGIGNYLRCDILYAAHLSPYRKFSDLTEGERTALMLAVLNVPAKAWRAARATLDASPDRHGRRFAPKKVPLDQRYVTAVYQKKVTAGGHPIEAIKQGGRTVWWCPSEQT